MTTAPPADLQAAWNEGARALRESRPLDALRQFERITASGQATSSVWVAVALAHRAAGDSAGAIAALDKARALDPKDLRALIMTADHHAEAGDARAASSFYNAVVQVAVAAGTVEKAMEAEDRIRAELKVVLEEDTGFAPYVEAEANRPFFDDHGMLGNPSWSAFYLVKGGRRVEENIARCPSVMEALEGAPLCEIPGRTPSVLFSLLRPGAHIAPHHGFMNGRYICHLPLIVPDDCAMRVGSETRPWAEGKACVFDDSIEHEAWNRHADRLRVVLIFDVWRPELSGEERELIGAILNAVDDYGGAAPPVMD